jgi:hypothetical protein
MILLYAILFISFEAVAEALLKKRYTTSFIFKGWVQWLIAIALFLVWFVIAYRSDIETWKLILGFVFVRFLVFDVVWNIVRGVKWNYYGTTKLYDRIMIRLGSFGWFIKAVAGIVGIVFLMGWS